VSAQFQQKIAHPPAQAGLTRMTVRNALIASRKIKFLAIVPVNNNLVAAALCILFILLLVNLKVANLFYNRVVGRGREVLFPVIGLPRPTLHRGLLKLAADYAFLVIDGTSRVYYVARSAIMASDLVIIPVQPLSYYVWAAKEIVDSVKENLSQGTSVPTATKGY